MPIGVDGPFPALQAALDFLELDRALALAGEAVRGGVDWLEVGTPLIKSEGLEAVRRIRAAFPGHVIVADLNLKRLGLARRLGVYGTPPLRMPTKQNIPIKKHNVCTSLL